MISSSEEIANFSISIEEIVQEKGVSYIDAIVMYCEETGYEVEVIAKLVSANLKSKIRVEAEDLHFLPKSNTMKLPIT